MFSLLQYVGNGTLPKMCVFRKTFVPSRLAEIKINSTELCGAVPLK